MKDSTEKAIVVMKDGLGERGDDVDEVTNDHVKSAIAVWAVMKDIQEGDGAINVLDD